MKKIFLVTFVAFASYSTEGQNLTYEELVHIDKMKISEVNNYLLSRNWTFDGSTNEKSGKNITWMFYNSQNKSDALAILNIITDGRNNIVNYTIATPST